jgi:hypothetical protein
LGRLLIREAKQVEGEAEPHEAGFERVTFVYAVLDPLSNVVVEGELYRPRFGEDAFDRRGVSQSQLPRDGLKLVVRKMVGAI